MFIFSEVYTWHQFDGLVIKAPGWFEYLLDLFSGSSNVNLKLFVSTFTPCWFTLDKDVASLPETFQHSLEYIDAIIHGLQNIYVHDAKVFENEQILIKQVHY
ncbi:hypothetical protein DPMN_054222 [Dreissena polymorpha]|uniref:Uncharacterized protein n=1 Tax=Dreissena polymorpha TaxID=45954 RepID=A0A9D4CMS0_DREPO|nr:hypothetical protein DPMN_054222 [Dreissena polymorpha]